MKNVSNNRRGRPRSGGKRSQGQKNRNYQSSGPDNKVRGSAQQVLDKYLAMARDASLAGDRIAAEGFYQHAEHYYRVLNERQDQQRNAQKPHPQKTDSRDRDNNQEPSDNTAPEAAGSEAPSEGGAESPKPRRRGRPPKAGNEAVPEAKAEVIDEA